MSHVGRLLVATPLIGDPNFERTVILVVADGDEGSLGYVLNRPTDVLVADVVEQLAARAAAPAVLFTGGPVGREFVNALAAGGVAGAEIAEAAGGWPVNGWSTLDLDHPAAGSVGPVRVFAGSAGWGVGQLQQEVADGAWWLVEGTPDDVLTGDPSGLWSRVLRRQPGELAWFAHYPEDPSAN